MSNNQLAIIPRDFSSSNYTAASAPLTPAQNSSDLYFILREDWPASLCLVLVMIVSPHFTPQSVLHLTIVI